MNPQNNDWKPTLAGFLAALAVLATEIQKGTPLTDWKTWILPAALAFLGKLSGGNTPSPDAPPPRLSKLPPLPIILFPFVVISVAAGALSGCSLSRGAGGDWQAGVSVTAQDIKTISDVVHSWDNAKGAAPLSSPIVKAEK